MDILVIYYDVIVYELELYDVNNYTKFCCKYTAEPNNSIGLLNIFRCPSCLQIFYQFSNKQYHDPGFHIFLLTLIECKLYLLYYQVQENYIRRISPHRHFVWTVFGPSFNKKGLVPYYVHKCEIVCLMYINAFSLNK